MQNAVNNAVNAVTNAVNAVNVPLAPSIASGVSDKKEVISFFCGNNKFVVYTA